ncbi:hypothetical protein GCM10020255_067780 [Rhodococcus baikonurensis]
MRYSAGEFDYLLSAADFAERVGEDLAVLGCDDLGEFAFAGVEKFAEVEQYLCAPGQGGVTPGGEGRRSSVDDSAGVLEVRQGESAGDLSGGGVGDGAVFSDVPANDLPSSQCAMTRVSVLVMVFPSGLVAQEFGEVYLAT